MKTRLQFLYIMCYHVNYFVSQPSVSGFCQWVWILQVGLDVASGSGLPAGLDMKTPWATLPAVSCVLHTTMASEDLSTYYI